MDKQKIARLAKLLTMFPGEERMIIAFEDGGKRLGTNCVIHDALIRELQELLGEKNVVVR